MSASEYDEDPRSPKNLALQEAQVAAMELIGRQDFRPPEKWPGWEPSDARPQNSTMKPFVGENGMRWEMDENCHHRIVSADGVGGDWAAYDNIAVSPCGRFIAVTDYWDSTLPVECLIEIKPVTAVKSLPE